MQFLREEDKLFMTQNNISQGKIFNATKWSSLAEIAARIASPIVNMVLARVLTPEAFGIVASITIITSFADIFTDAGFQKFIVQHDYNTEEELNAGSNVAFTCNLVLSFLIYLIIFCFKKPLASAVGCAAEYWGIAVASLTVLCTAIPSVAVARFRRDLNFRPLFYTRIIGAFIPLIVTVPLAFIFRNYWALIVGTLIQKLFIAVATLILSKWKPKIEFNKILFQEMIGFSIWNLLETLSIWFAGQANIFIVSNTLNSYYLGLYKTAMAAVNSCLGIITAAFTPVFFSALSRYQNNVKRYNETFDGFQYLLSLIVIPLGVGLFVYRKLALSILLGNQWTEATFFLGLWALISTVTIVFSNTACEVYRSYGKPKVSLILQLCYLVVYVPVIIFSSKQGFVTLTIAGSLVRLLPVVADLIALHYMFNIRLSEVLNNTYYSFIASIIMAGVAFMLQKISSSILWSFISIIICACVYIFVVLVNKNQRAKLFKIEAITQVMRKVGLH